MIHIGFTGTREGMSQPQLDALRDLLDETLGLNGFTAHHGDCVGADEQFHALCREPRGGQVTIHGHPGPEGGRFRAYCNCDTLSQPDHYMKRNAAIVAASQIVIAAPLQDEPQPKGGTWATIRMALRALRRGTLRELYVVGRDGVELDHARWPL